MGRLEFYKYRYSKGVLAQVVNFSDWKLILWHPREWGWNFGFLRLETFFEAITPFFSIKKEVQ